MDEQATSEYTEFVHAHWRNAFRTAYLLTGDHQTAFTKALLSWPRVRQVKEPAAYVRKIVVNQTISWRRRMSSREVPGLDLLETPRAAMPTE